MQSLSGEYLLEFEALPQDLPLEMRSESITARRDRGIPGRSIATHQAHHHALDSQLISRHE